MDLETLSNKILDEGFGLGLEHSDEDQPNETESLEHNETKTVEESNPTIDNKTDVVDETDNLECNEAEFTDESDFLEHYGILGMKWGVRKDRKGKPRKRERRFEGETDQQYQNRMDRDSRERQQKAAIKEHLKTQKAQIKSQEKQQRLTLKSQERQLKETNRAREKERAEQRAQQKEDAKRRKAEDRRKAKEKTNSKPLNARSLTDKELNDAIQRFRNEQTYKDLSVQNQPLLKKKAIQAATIGGGILLTVGTAVATQQLKKVGNEKAEDFLVKHKIIRPPDPRTKGFSQDEISILKQIVDNVVKQNGQ